MRMTEEQILKNHDTTLGNLRKFLEDDEIRECQNVLSAVRGHIKSLEIIKHMIATKPVHMLWLDGGWNMKESEEALKKIEEGIAQLAGSAYIMFM